MNFVTCVPKSETLSKFSPESSEDEYNVPFDGDEFVHIFVSRNFVGDCKNHLAKMNFEIKDSNIHILVNKSDFLDDLTEAVYTPNETSLMLLLFWGYSKRDGEMTLEDGEVPFTEIWSRVIAQPDSTFRNKPKVFIFNVFQSKSETMRDGRFFEAKAEDPYEAPKASDILIIYKKNIVPSESEVFMGELTRQLIEHGKIEDICTITTTMETTTYSRPLIISTLRKKLYITPPQLRGHYANIQSLHSRTVFLLEDIERNIDKDIPNKMKIKENIKNVDYELSDSRSNRRNSVIEDHFSKPSSFSNSVLGRRLSRNQQPLEKKNSKDAARDRKNHSKKPNCQIS